MGMKNGLMAISTALIMSQTADIKAQEKMSQDNIERYKERLGGKIFENFDTSTLYCINSVSKEGDGGYLISEGKVYYIKKKELVLLPEADTESFVVVSSDYARDKNAIYYKPGRHDQDVEKIIVEGLDSKTFEHCTVDVIGYADRVYYKDSKRLYYVEGKNLTPIEGSNPLLDVTIVEYSVREDFPPRAIGYDSWTIYRYMINNGNVYLWGKSISGVDANSFKYLDGGYSKDSNSVFYKHAIIPGADPASFQVLESDDGFFYGEDKNNTFIDISHKPKEIIYFGDDEDQE